MEKDKPPESGGIEDVLRILARAAHDEPPFPPAELYSEGWMLRLVMEGHHNGHNTLPLTVTSDSRWYSEARLFSPFQPSRRGDPLGEGITHADGVIGQFQIREDTTAGFTLSSGSQFAVIEAKMGSKLSAGTTRVKWYDQAVRNVVAMAWAIDQSGRSPAGLESLAFIVTAPAQRFDEEPSFAEWTSKQSLSDKFERRVDLYQDTDPARHQSLTRFREQVYEPFLDRLQVVLWPWEDAIEGVEDAEFSSNLSRFYNQCLSHAGGALGPSQ